MRGRALSLLVLLLFFSCGPALANPSGTIIRAYDSMDAWKVQFSGAEPSANDILQVSRDGQPICQVIYSRVPNYGMVITRVSPEPDNLPRVGDAVEYLKPGPSVSQHRFAMLRAYQQTGVVANLQGGVYHEYYNGAVYGGTAVLRERHSGRMHWDLPGPPPYFLNR